MLNIQEIVDKTKEQRKRIEYAMDGYGYYHPNIPVKNEGTASITNGLKPADAQKVMTSIRHIPINRFLKAFLAKSGTTGISGAAYLVPVKAHDLLLNYSAETDKVPVISRQVIYDWKGDEWKLSVADDESYIPRSFSSGGAIADANITAKQVTLYFDLANKKGLNIAVGMDLIEDVIDYDIVDWHIREAARAFGREATDRALTVLQTATDGVGTVNSAVTGDADETKLTNGATSDIVTATRDLGDDRFTADTLITTPEAWGNSISMQAAPTGWDTLAPAPGFHNKIGHLDVLFNTGPNLHASADLVGAAFTNCISIIYSRGDAMVTGRKRWLRINEYADPVADLAGAVVVGEQDSVSIYNDSVYRLTET